jgi:hypothetical protein
VLSPRFLPACLTSEEACGFSETQTLPSSLARIFHQLLSRDYENGRACPPSRALRRGGRATRQPQGVGFEAYLNGTSQGELVLLRYAQDKFPRRRNTRGRQASGSESPQLGEKDGYIIRARCVSASVKTSAGQAAQSRKRVPSFVVAAGNS